MRNKLITIFGGLREIFERYGLPINEIHFKEGDNPQSLENDNSVVMRDKNYLKLNRRKGQKRG